MASMWAFIKDHPYELGMVFILSTITMPFLIQPLEFLLLGDFKFRIGLYLLSVIGIILIAEFAYEDDSYHSIFSLYRVSRYFIRDFVIFLIVNIVTFTYGNFILWLI